MRLLSGKMLFINIYTSIKKYLINILLIAYFPSLAIVFYFVNSKELVAWEDVLLVVLSLDVIALQANIYFAKEKAEQRFQSRSIDKMDEHSKKIDQIGKGLEEKEKKGTATIADYLHHMVVELQAIRVRMDKGKNTAEYLFDYFKKIAEIPNYYNKNEWLQTEKIFYDSAIAGIANRFAGIGMLSSSGAKQCLDTLKNEREQLLKSKERDFDK